MGDGGARGWKLRLDDETETINLKKTMNITKLTTKEIREVAPTDCLYAEEAGEYIMGGIQMPMPEPDCWPSGYDLEREAQALFGAVKISNHKPDDDDSAATWIVIRA